MQVRSSEDAETEHSTTGGTVVTIQFLRAAAAGLIVVHHAMAPPALQPYYRHVFGEFGVDVFFVISGYIMWTTTAAAHRSPAAFWAARIVRIVPLYWLFTTLFLGVAVIAPRALFTTPGLDATFVLASYLFVPAVHPHVGDVVPLYTLGWTLTYEMFFYLLFGLSLFVSSRGLRLVLLVAPFALLVSSHALFAPAGPILSTYTDPIILEFLAGVGVAAGGRWLARCPPAIGGIGIAGAFAWLVHVTLSDVSPPRLLAYGVPAVVIVAGALTFERFARARPSRLGLLLGDASYSIYLAHPFAQRAWYFAVAPLPPEAPAASGAIIHVGGALVAGVLGGVISYLLLERPMLAAGRRLLGVDSRLRRTNVPRPLP
jgi:exopolysaccharide production protein ExoZ